MATKKKALAAGTGVNSGSPYDDAGGTSYDPNAPEGPPAPTPPAPKKKGKGFRGPMRVFHNPIRDKFKGLTAKGGAAHSALHFGLHSRPLPGLPAEGDTDAWFALYNSESADELSEAVRIAMRSVTREVQRRLENNQYMRALGVYVPAWTPELSTAGGIGAAGQAALIQLATQKMREVARTSPALFTAVQQILAAPPGWSDKEFRESWAAATTNPDGTSPERDALYASAPTMSRNPNKQKVMDEWRARTEIRALETPMMTIISEALVAAVPNHTYDIQARQGEIDAVATALWGQMRGAHARGETQLLFSEMFQRERDQVRDKVKTLWNEAATAVGTPNLLPMWDDISHVLRDRVVAGMLLNVLRGEAIIGGNSPRPGVFGLQDFIQAYAEKAAEQEAARLLSEFPEMTLEEAQAEASEAAGLTGRSADLLAAAGDTTGPWEEYLPVSS